MCDKFSYVVLKQLQIVSLMLLHFERGTHQNCPLQKENLPEDAMLIKLKLCCMLHQNLLQKSNMSLK